MSPFASLSIRNKIIGIIVVITAVVLLGGFSFVMFNDVRMYRQQMVSNAVLLARVTGNSCVSDLAFGDREETSETLRRLTAGESVLAAFVYDDAGRLFAHFRRAGVSAAVPKVAAGERRMIGSELYVSEPIVYEGERYGSIVLVMPTRALTETIRRYVWTIAAIVLALVLISLSFAIRLERVVSGPLLDLSAAARNISERHDYGIRVQKRSSDEIGLLCDAFNEMLGEIERRQKERDEADRRTREKSRFLANMSHELRTPLNAIIGFSEILLDRLDPRISSRERLFLQNIHTSGQHLLGLVNDILDLSKVEAGLMELRVEPFPVEPAVEGVCALMKGVASRLQVEIEIDCGPALPPLEADAVKIKQILYNLISNAVKFSTRGSVVTARATQLSSEDSPLHEPTIRFEVVDRGIGIDPVDQERIFEEFRQVDSSARPEGTGLGLALVRKLVRLHRGEVTVESSVGLGSRFTVDIPLRSSAVEVQAKRVSAAIPRQIILAVEERIESYRVIERQLVSAGFMPLHAPNGEEAVRLAHALVPSAITLDLELSGRNGWDVLRRLKADSVTRRIPVIIVSMGENRRLAFALGADDYIVKPLAEGQLAEAIVRAAQRITGGLDLLVVSDDAGVHQNLAAELSPLGFEVRHAWSADAGMSEASRRPNALTLVDATAAGIPGIEMALRLKNDPTTANAPVVLLTSSENVDCDAPVGCSWLSGDDGQLVTAVRALLDRRSEQEKVG